MPTEIIEAANWPAIRDALKPTPCLWGRLIPAHGITLLHGSPSSGKSAIMWGVANAMADGVPFLGIPTVRARAFFIITDMEKFTIKERWDNARPFTPKFDFAITSEFDAISPKFPTTELYKTIGEFVKAKGYDMIVFDALKDTCLGHPLTDDTTPTAWRAAIRKWLPDTAIVAIHHDRKVRYGQNGEPIPPGKEDFNGSGLWRANMVSQLHCWPTGEHITALRHEKGQSKGADEDLIRVYIDMNGIAESWDQKRADEVKAKYYAAVKATHTEGATVSEKDAAVAKFHGVSERTARRWRSL